MVREWLLNQAAGGYIEYDAKSKRFSMTPEQAAAFADDTGPAFMGGAFDIIGSVHRDESKVTQAFRSGKGLPWGEHDACLFCGTERFFAANYRANLIDSWIPAIDGLQERLRRGAHVADVGCGHGASTVLMAKAFPESKFVGLDFHAPSIECAARRASEAGVRNVQFKVADAASFPTPPGGYDFVACFDCLHDMGDPTGCATQIRMALKPDGIWMIVEPAAADTVEGNLNPVARVFSAASTMICVPASMAFNGPALGACAGAARIREVVTKGGFGKFKIAAQTPFNFVFDARI
jgi:2-polyprenyl-3-methyl-5-hydroxy-6-metoxy-1,4-benzoquinol methylase